VKLGARRGLLEPKDEIVALDRRAHFAQPDPKHAADAIAIDRARQRLLADDDPGPAAFARGHGADHLQESTFAAPAAAKHRIEGARAREPVPAASTEHCRGTSVDQGARRARPFARRAERTLRPPTLFIRARKPCVRLRLTTEGWNVRFMGDLEVKKPYIRARYRPCCQSKPANAGSREAGDRLADRKFPCG